MSRLLEYEVDGSVLTIDDGQVDGRAIRVAAQLVPPSGYVLIRTDGGLAQSVGLEEPVILSEGRRPIFRSFESDHLNMLEVDERGWEWGADEISDAEIRSIGRISDDRELILDSDADRPIARGATIRLSGGGAERIRSRRVAPATVSILVNARRREFKPGSISFEELVALAFTSPPTGAQVAFTVSYRKGPLPRAEGSLVPGQSAHVIEGMAFHVTATDKS